MNVANLVFPPANDFFTVPEAFCRREDGLVNVIHDDVAEAELIFSVPNVVFLWEKAMLHVTKSFRRPAKALGDVERRRIRRVSSCMHGANAAPPWRMTPMSMESFLPYLWVALGSAIGGALRHGVNRASLALLGPNLPGGTLFVNIVGCFVMGLLAGWFSLRGEDASPGFRLFLITGIVGGFTTFSAFSLDAATLWQRGDGALAAAYVAVSVLGSIAGVFAGLALMRLTLGQAN